MYCGIYSETATLNDVKGLHEFISMLLHDKTAALTQFSDQELDSLKNVITDEVTSLICHHQDDRQFLFITTYFCGLGHHTPFSRQTF